MQPYRVKLFYRGRNWRSIKFELGTDEIGDSFDYDLLLSDEIRSELESYGFKDIRRIPVIPIHHQIVQKIHASTEDGSERAHDLVDLQLISQNEDLDLVLVRKTCVRLFNFRNKHSWPPKFEENEAWTDLYFAAREDLPVLGTVNEAMRWGNRFISEIDNSVT
jgi:hypothetical protein